MWIVDLNCVAHEYSGTTLMHKQSDALYTFLIEPSLFYILTSEYVHILIYMDQNYLY